jgi:protein LSM14
MMEIERNRAKVASLSPYAFWLLTVYLTGEFDFAAGLSHFNKNEVLASVATEGKKENAKYVKDDFFDSLSCDVLDRAEGRTTRLNNQEERALNSDTFGAIAVQSNFRRGFRGGRGGGRGGGGGGGYHQSNYNSRGRGYGNGGGSSYRGGRGRGGGRQQGAPAGAVEA